MRASASSTISALERVATAPTELRDSGPTSGVKHHFTEEPGRKIFSRYINLILII
jgi:hypothetical protein